MKNFPTLQRRIAVLMTLIVFIFGANCFAQTTSLPSSLLWKISGNGAKKPSYPFGTYHLVPSGYLPENGKVRKAFEESEGVIVEVVIDSTAMIQSQMMAMMYDHKMTELLQAADYKVVADELQATYGYDLKMFEQLRPVNIALMLGIFYSQEAAPWLGQFDGQPLDAYFATQGKAEKKNILALETVESQMKLLYQSETVESQAESLLQMVQEKEAMREVSANVADAWKLEDLNAMAEAGRKSFESFPSFGSEAALLKDRNEAWIQILPKHLKKGKQFIAVGALHLTGEFGLLQLLRNAGYTVEPVLGK